MSRRPHRFSPHEQVQAELFYRDLVGLRPQPRPRLRSAASTESSELFIPISPHPGHALLPGAMQRMRDARAKKLARFKELFVFHNLATSTDTIDEAAVERLLRQFQTSKRLSPTGRATPPTLWALQAPWARTRQLTVSRVPADKLPNVQGSTLFMIRSDVVAPYTALRNDVLAAGGVITSAGGMRDLSAAVSAGRSVTSLHYTGVAFDLSTVSGMLDPANDRYIVTAEPAGRWRVWCKSDTGQQRTLQAVKWANQRTQTVSVSARVFDFTTMCARHGFEPIAHRSDFPQNYLSAEWWHFQCEAVLVPDVSQFGAELLSISHYSSAVLKRHPNIWANRALVFKQGWG